MARLIEHSGIVKDIDHNIIHVLINQQTACSDCHANGTCITTENNQRLIEIEEFDPIYSVGDNVIVYGDQSIGLRAVLLAFVLPFILILTALLILNSLTANEVLSGALSVAVLLPYYIILSCYNKKLKAKFKFKIKKENEY